MLEITTTERPKQPTLIFEQASSSAQSTLHPAAPQCSSKSLHECAATQCTLGHAGAAILRNASFPWHAPK